MDLSNSYADVDRWAVHYHETLSEKYYEFCKMFSENEKPTYREFVLFVWSNTKKVHNPMNGKVQAKVN